MEMNKGKLYTFLLLIAIIGLFSACFHAYRFHRLPWYLVYSDIVVFAKIALNPELPYIDKMIEYPIITGLFIHFMGILGQNYYGYYLQSTLFLILFATISTYFLHRTLEKKDEKRLIIYWILAPSMLFFLIYNWDIIPLFFVVIAFFAIKHDKDYLAALFLALGFSSKFYPVIYLLPLLLKKNRINELIKTISVFGVTTLVINIFFIVSNFEGWYYFASFNSLRSPNPDSIWGVISFFIPQLSVSLINILSFFFFLAGSIGLMWRFRSESTVKLCFIMTLNFMIFNKTFSPQYLLWLLPFFVLLPLTRKKLFYALELSNLVVLFTILPYLFLYPHASYLYMCYLFVIIRHIILLYLLLDLFEPNLIFSRILLKLKKT